MDGGPSSAKRKKKPRTLAKVAAKSLKGHPCSFVVFSNYDYNWKYELEFSDSQRASLTLHTFRDDDDEKEEIGEGGGEDQKKKNSNWN
eukprot:CAMPEP_0180031784 /NCGR_PEP_ID=MMETSP0984-20121128/28100_1 /TAXON_ID=483367 /ORGANISM="non described non described, Strain CCMP 2436" /LENGTH=87 /DNA_ID=CAMNT_0021956959 /DNA_START=82 /DNA_END=345 /DNA_ORIENTATION=-